MKSKCPLQCSQKPVMCLHPEPDESNAQSRTTQKATIFKYVFFSCGVKETVSK
jgi:(2Fe-2S) ferredoxin